MRSALHQLPDLAGTSQLYETEPVGYEDQGPFLNMVAELNTDLSSRELLEVCQDLEDAAQRQREIVNGPRTLDLDILWIKGEETAEPDLVVPHPRMFERGFVMIPLNDLDPKLAGEWMQENLNKEGNYPGIRHVGKLSLRKYSPPPIIDTKESLRQFTDAARKKGKSIGLVPTMGAMHEGHTSLIEHCKSENDVSIVTVFVNPLQFNETADFKSYPRDMERDLETLEDFKTNLIFAPTQEEMYPEPANIDISIGTLTSELEGEYRPGHLEGVCTIVAKLFNIVGECRAYFGEKDYQQLLTIRKMVKDLDIPVEVIGCPTVREPEGLALSSRNVLLSLEEKEATPHLHNALLEGKELIEKGESTPSRVVKKIEKSLKIHPRINLEYLDIRNASDFSAPKRMTEPVRILLAVKIGEIRLIDNILATPLYEPSKKEVKEAARQASAKARAEKAEAAKVQKAKAAKARQKEK